MTTALDIIDTAVKIGLGAIIAGMTSYFISNKNRTHEVHKNLAKDKKELLFELTKQLDEGTSLRNNAVGLISIKRKDILKDETIDLKDELLLLTKASNQLKIAISNSYLIGNIKLAKLIENTYFYIEDERIHFHKYGIHYDHEFIDKNIDKIEELKDQIYNQYKKSLESIYSNDETL